MGNIWVIIKNKIVRCSSFPRGHFTYEKVILEIPYTKYHKVRYYEKFGKVIKRITYYEYEYQLSLYENSGIKNSRHLREHLEKIERKFK